MKDQKVYWKKTDRGNSTNLIQFFHQLRQNFPKKKLAIILDNGPIHKSHQTKAFLKKHSWLTVHHLPPYSPEYNPIERFWGWLKRHVYGSESHQSIDNVFRKIRKLIWHYHEKWLGQSLKLSFQAYEKLQIVMK